MSAAASVWWRWWSAKSLQSCGQIVVALSWGDSPQLHSEGCCVVIRFSQFALAVMVSDLCKNVQCVLMIAVPEDRPQCWGLQMQSSGGGGSCVVCQLRGGQRRGGGQQNSAKSIVMHLQLFSRVSSILKSIPTSAVLPQYLRIFTKC